MKRALPLACIAVLTNLFLVGCATVAQNSAATATRAPTDASQYIVVTGRNDPRAESLHPGSTPRGYDVAGRYGVTAGARLEARALERDYGIRQISAWPIAALQVHCIMFQLPSTMTRSAMIAKLGTDRRVESVQPLNEFTSQSASDAASPSQEIAPVLTPYNDPYAKLQVALRELSVVAAQRQSRGAGVRVAVIDTGVDFDHPDLKGRVVSRQNFVDGDDLKFRHDMHGTQVSGVIAAIADNGIGIVGIAPDAHVIALKACWQGASGSPAMCNSFTLAQALQAAIGAHADVVNMSLSGPADPLLTRLVARGALQGTIFVGAAGRSAGGNSFPADVEQVLAVDSAEDASGNPRHLLAPGRDILTLVPGGHYDFASGSSLAAAEISGIVALMLAERPHLTVEAVRTLLMKSSREVDSPAGAIRAVDACAALRDPLKNGQCDPDIRAAFSRKATHTP